jgi:hypothetical protein
MEYIEMKRCKRKITCGFRVQTKEVNFFLSSNLIQTSTFQGLIVRRTLKTNYSGPFKVKNLRTLHYLSIRAFWEVTTC